MKDKKKLKKQISKRKKKLNSQLSIQRDAFLLSLIKGDQQQISINDKDMYQKFEEIFENQRKIRQTDLEEDEIAVEMEEKQTQKIVPKEKTKKEIKEEKQNQLAQLKVLVNRPELVEDYDVNSKDPFFLVYLKGYKNSVPVPNNWEYKKKQFYFKKGLYKQLYKLPEYIENTGISKLRDPLAEKNTMKMIRMKMRERMNPKMGKIDIDYEVLHDAFFKYQTEPTLSQFGDLYFEGKEEMQKMKKFKPGRISMELRKALGITENEYGPWIYNMQKYGPPPSYPNLHVPGLKEIMDHKNQEQKQSLIDKTYFWGQIQKEEEDQEDYREIEENEYMKIKTFNQFFNLNSYNFKMKILVMIMMACLINVETAKQISKKNLKENRTRGKERNLYMIANERKLKKTQKKNLVKKKKAVKKSHKKQSFTVPRTQINKVAKQGLKERKLTQENRQLIGDSPQTIDSMPLLLFGEYDIVIEKV